jgi:hypothetical protein
MMQDLNKSDLENFCREFSRAFQGILAWKWDSWFESVLAEFGVGDKDSIRAILERDLGSAWDSSTVGKAPDRVQIINSNFGGIRPGQLLFTSDPSRDAIIFCAWWPWGDGKTISIRIAPSCKKLSDSEKAEQTKLLKGWFGI